MSYTLSRPVTPLTLRNPTAPAIVPVIAPVVSEYSYEEQLAQIIPKREQAEIQYDQAYVNYWYYACYESTLKTIIENLPRPEGFTIALPIQVETNPWFEENIMLEINLPEIAAELDLPISGFEPLDFEIVRDKDEFVAKLLSKSPPDIPNFIVPQAVLDFFGDQISDQLSDYVDPVNEVITWKCALSIFV